MLLRVALTPTLGLPPRQATHGLNVIRYLQEVYPTANLSGDSANALWSSLDFRYGPSTSTATLDSASCTHGGSIPSAPGQFGANRERFEGFLPCDGDLAGPGGCLERQATFAPTWATHDQFLEVQHAAGNDKCLDASECYFCPHVSCPLNGSSWSEFMDTGICPTSLVGCRPRALPGTVTM